MSFIAQNNTRSVMLTMVCAFAELERNLIAERTASALQHKKQQRQAYSPTPYGFDRVGDLLVPNPDEQAVVARIKVMHADGASLRRIAATLNDKGIPSKTGKRWAPSAVWYLLQNELYQAS